jgi:hypothetical protein
MNDLDLRTALHRDADLVGEPAPDLLDQLVQRRQHQRRQRAGMLTAGLAVVLIAAGIPVGAAFMTRSEGAPAAHTTVAPTPSVTPEVVAPTTPAPPSSAPTSSAAATLTATPEPDSAAPVLGPDGLGSLKLGMSRDEAEATGLVGPFRNEPNSDQCLWRSALTGAPADEGVVLHSETLGVATIDAYPGVRTPEGITFGSSLAAVRSAYPGFHMFDPTAVDSNLQTGRGYSPVPGNSEAVYRIVVDDGKVVELTLQYVRQNCYE